MSSFEVKIRRLSEFEAIKGADRIESAVVGGFRVVVQKGRFLPGDLGVYVPEAAVVPDRVLKLSGFWKPCEACEGTGSVRTLGEDNTEIVTDCEVCKGRGGTGTLAGGKGNRVKPIRLKGVVSEGILLDLDIFERLGFEPVMEGLDPYETIEEKDVADALGIEKYIVPIPANLSGKVYELAGTILANSAPENVKAEPDLFVEGEPVVISEKVHGSATQCGVKDGEFFVTSKGMGSKGLVLEDERDEQGRSTNTYHRAVQSVGGEEVVRKISEQWGDGGDVYLYGELVPCQGGGFTYGVEPGTAHLLAFDIRIGGHFVDHAAFVEITSALDIPTVPVLYSGPYSSEVLAQHTGGREQVSGRETHIREGCVVRAEPNRYTSRGRRAVLKSISDKYLAKNDRTEYT